MKIVKLILCFFPIAVFGQDGLDAFNKKLKEKYSVDFSVREDIYSKDKFSNNSSVKVFFNSGLNKAYGFNFLSRTKNKKNIRQNFRVYIYVYSSIDAASNKFNELLKLDTFEDVLSKDYDYLILKGNKIIRVDGPCLLSRENWQKLRKEVIDISISNISGKKGLKSIESFCGGGFKVE